MFFFFLVREFSHYGDKNKMYFFFFFFFSGEFEKIGNFCWTFETKKIEKILVATWAIHYGQPIKHIHFL
jgi:hypothetical protein